ncbi:MAG: biotin--[acetyl-CoA-carboxylase] ligase [Gemmatimonadaceae bacterium]|jgi:BirA family biotin operon repressor/biotin-[acetyl-CoA-carboxylase] ligase|nr:biotin--[acetyl-CoA-carboxylase] ligase [Gemmatimonadaceae bacterium]
MGDAAWDGATGDAWAARLGVPRVEVHDALPSTNDRAHALAVAGAPAGTVVLAHAQHAGRGRQGRTWASAAGAGVWASVLERPRDAAAAGVLALRVGLALAAQLAPLAAPAPLTLKWPNDVFLGDGKLAGILIEARWQDGLLQHAVIGVGINLAPPADQPAAAALGATRAGEAFTALVRAARSAAAATGPLDDGERAAWAARDRTIGRLIRAPGQGTVVGVAADGGLQVRGSDGLATFHAGSLVLA